MTILTPEQLLDWQVVFFCDTTFQCFVFNFPPCIFLYGLVLSFLCITVPLDHLGHLTSHQEGCICLLDSPSRIFWVRLKEHQQTCHACPSLCPPTPGFLTDEKIGHFSGRCQYEMMFWEESSRYLVYNQLQFLRDGQHLVNSWFSLWAAVTVNWKCAVLPCHPPCCYTHAILEVDQTP